MRDTIDPVHVYSQMKVIDDEENSAASALEQEILDRGHVQSDDVIDVVGDLIAERVKDINEVSALKALAIEIYQEAMMEK